MERVVTPHQVIASVVAFLAGVHTEADDEPGLVPEEHRDGE